MKVLLVEDNIQLNTTIINFLQTVNYEVTPLFDGEVAIDTIDKTDFDLYLIDINIPNINGLEIIKYIRKKDTVTPIVMMTASVELTDFETAFKNGCNEYIKKPFFLKELEIRINNLLNKEKNKTAKLEQIKKKFEKLATIDYLTNVHNRYSLMKIFAKEINRSHRYNQPLSVMMVDIDFFKKVNDTYGHNIGDEVLVSLSNIMNKNLRDIDIIGRYGGEEFLIILPNTNIEDAKNFAERLRREVSEYQFETVGHITISIGLTQLIENENINEIFKRADELLYKSKNNGRNMLSFN